MVISVNSAKNTKKSSEYHQMERGSDEEIEKLRQTLLKEEKKFSEEIEKLNKSVRIFAQTHEILNFQFPCLKSRGLARKQCFH